MVQQSLSILVLGVIEGFGPPRFARKRQDSRIQTCSSKGRAPRVASPISLAPVTLTRGSSSFEAGTIYEAAAKNAVPLNSTTLEYFSQTRARSGIFWQVENYD